VFEYPIINQTQKFSNNNFFLIRFLLCKIKFMNWVLWRFLTCQKL
jgi:hypothetical protein